LYKKEKRRGNLNPPGLLTGGTWNKGAAIFRFKEVLLLKEL
jgi:hypothetical protein